MTEHRILGTNFKGPFPEGTDSCVVATGCFWGSEKAMWRMPGMYTTAVVYAGGPTKDPTYQKVCSGNTGHTEAVLCVWETDKLSFTDVVRMYLQCHDPTQVNGQGNDRGTQYRTALYYNSDDQKRITEAAIASYEKSLGGRTIATELRALKPKGDVEYYYAEDYHQQYLASPGARQYCSAQPQGVQLENAERWLPEDLKGKYTPKLPEAFWEKHAPTPHCVLREPHEQFKWPPA
eukprot:CAMPEP_0204822614 /NCGR_PEP_ID=MMETSP1346-20131115/800_1 /ASSEMBLY_ACC=CAM_ASM_000771 /TAXON_ID=215587 /ORGANISM="Aplanochytrium stocchinoi, Strain GSBS06" /LENGTH=233 /DNA_ID=CAMNT_0051948929 /DNA_START=276 /DNA_END=977 /DNA_ORIENTATION=-